ncbi:MAG: reverse transcriptase domain-containing protein [Desulfobacterales bacterium]|nr:reverse transcriptase domain-containing protein [Desulfobacterales bacterium]
MIPKEDGSERPLGIPTIRDRVAQMAVKLVIEPIFEADFCDNSYGFRPRKSAHDAVDDVAHTLNKGYSEVIDADLSKYFDTIPHAKLMAMVAERICDGAMLHLIQMWLKAPVMEVDKDGTKRNIGGGKGNRKGTPQGGVISPLLVQSLPAFAGQDLGAAAACSSGWAHASSDTRTISSCFAGKAPSNRWRCCGRYWSGWDCPLTRHKTRVVNAYQGKFRLSWI